MDTDTQAEGVETPVEDTDTVETPQSEASPKDKTETPEATQENAQAEEAEAPETKAEDTVEEKLLAGKYKTPEELEKAYKDLNSKFTNTAQEKAELAKILNEAFATPEPGAQASEQEETDSYEEPENNPAAQRLAALETKSEIQDFLMSHPEAQAQELTKIIVDDPLISEMSSPRAKLEYAYLKSQNMSSSEAIAEAEKKGAQTAHAKTAEKETAKVESARKASPPDQKSDLINRMRYGDKAARAEVISNIPAVQEMRRQAGLE